MEIATSMYTDGRYEEVWAVDEHLSFFFDNNYVYNVFHKCY